MVDLLMECLVPLFLQILATGFAAILLNLGKRKQGDARYMFFVVLYQHVYSFLFVHLNIKLAVKRILINSLRGYLGFNVFFLN